MFGLKLGRVSAVLAGGAVATLIGGAAVAITEANYLYSAPKTGFFSISPLSIAPDGSDSDDSYFISYSDNTLSGQGCYNTGVNVPQGSTLKSGRFYYRSGANGDPHFRLYRTALATGAAEEIAGVRPANDTGTRKAVAGMVAPDYGPVNNNAYVYGFTVCLNQADYFDGAVISYEYTNAGD